MRRDTRRLVLQWGMVMVLLATVARCSAAVPVHGSPGRGTPATVFSLRSPVQALSWCPAGPQLVYVTGGELREWPSGRRTKLSPKDSSIPVDPEDAIPLVWEIRWRADGRELAVIHRKADAFIVDIRSFRVTRVIHRVRSVWWQGSLLCYLPGLDWGFRASDRHAWHCGSRTEYGPKGYQFTDVTPAGDVMLAYVSRAGGYPEEFANLALVSRDPASGALLRIRHLLSPSRSRQLMEVTEADEVQWNAQEGAGLVVKSASSDGGQTACYLYVATWQRTYDLDGYYPGYTVVAAAKPAWLGDKVLAFIRLVRQQRVTGTDSYSAEMISRLVLWSPWQGRPRTLLEVGGYSGVTGVAASRDGQALAIGLTDERRSAYYLAVTRLSGIRRLSAYTSSRE